MLTIRSYIGKSKIYSAKSYLQWGLKLVLLVFYSDALLNELNWQVLIERYLTSLLFVHQLTLRLRSDLGKNRA